MNIRLAAVEAVFIRGSWCEVIARLDEDVDGPFSVIEVTVADSGEPMFKDDDVIDWHISAADLRSIAEEYARHGRMLPRTAPEPVLAEVISMPVRDDADSEAAA